MPFNKTIELASFGNTIVDIEYTVSDELLMDLGIEKSSMTLIDHPTKNRIMAMLGPSSHMSSGGSTANSVFIAALRGLKTFHCGVVGNDTLGSVVHDAFAGATIQSSLSAWSQSGDTACCLVLITPDGERTMLTYLGVSSRFLPTFDYDSIINRTRIMLIEGYLIPDDTVYDIILNTVIPLAAQHKTTLALTLSNDGIVTAFTNRFHELMDTHCIHTVFCNKAESFALTHHHHVADQAAYMSHHIPEVIITDNQYGAYSHHNGVFHHHPTTPVTPLDTTGAGDAFAGIYLAHRIRSRSVSDACIAANYIAGHAVQGYSPRPHQLQTAIAKMPSL